MLVHYFEVHHCQLLPEVKDRSAATSKMDIKLNEAQTEDSCNIKTVLVKIALVTITLMKA